MAKAKQTTEAAPTAEPTAEAVATEPSTRQPGDEPDQPRRFAPDPFTIASDYAVGVKLREHRRFRRAEIEFADGKPSQAVIDQLKADQFRWNSQEKLWVRPVKGEDAMATRIEAERTYQAVVALIRQEKGLAGPDTPSF